METSEAMIPGLTAALVLITAYYAWQTNRMAEEMRKTRAMSVLPKLALKWHAVGPEHTFIRIASVGPGAALDVDVEVVFVPKKDDVEEIRRRVQVSLMTPGDFEDVMPIRTTQDQQIMDTATLAASFDRIEMDGTLKDVVENEHPANDALSDLGDWLRIRKDALLSWRHPDLERRLAKEMAGQFEKPLGKLVKAVDQIRQELRARRQNDE